MAPVADIWIPVLPTNSHPPASPLFPGPGPCSLLDDFAPYFVGTSQIKCVPALGLPTSSSSACSAPSPDL